MFQYLRFKYQGTLYPFQTSSLSELKGRLNHWVMTGILFVLLILVTSEGLAQTSTNSIERAIVPEGYTMSIANEHDTIKVVNLPEVVVLPQITFMSEKERQEYLKLIRDVKRALPYAKLIYNTLIETYEYIETMPDDKTKHAHLKRMEKDLYNRFRPEMRKMTLAQGKLLIKLVDRECNQTSYNLASAYLGRARATFWNIFAGLFGASLKTQYDPTGKDAMTERVVMLVERGQI